MEPASGVILWFDPALFLQLCTENNISPGRLVFALLWDATSICKMLKDVQ